MIACRLALMTRCSMSRQNNSNQISHDINDSGPDNIGCGLQQINNRTSCSCPPPPPPVLSATPPYCVTIMLFMDHLRNTAVHIRLCVVACVLLVEHREVALFAGLRFMGLTLVEESSFSSPARNTDKRDGFHAALSFILTPRSFPLMCFNGLLSFSL